MALKPPEDGIRKYQEQVFFPFYEWKTCFPRSTIQLKTNGWNESLSLWEVFALLSTGLQTAQTE